MLSQPPVDFFSYGISGYQFIPLPKGGWKWISTLAQAQQVLAVVKTFCQNAAISTEGGADNFDLLFPAPNPEQYAVWTIVGQITTPKGVALNINEWAGDLWDRGPLAGAILPSQGAPTAPFGGCPSTMVDRNADGKVGGQYLVYLDDEDTGGPDGSLQWSDTPQQNVS